MVVELWQEHKATATQDLPLLLWRRKVREFAVWLLSVVEQVTTDDTCVRICTAPRFPLTGIIIIFLFLVLTPFPTTFKSNGEKVTKTSATIATAFFTTSPSLLELDESLQRLQYHTIVWVD